MTREEAVNIHNALGQLADAMQRHREDLQRGHPAKQEDIRVHNDLALSSVQKAHRYYGSIRTELER